MDIRSDPLLAPLEHIPEGVRAGDCVLTEKLGQGGMGVVYLGWHTNLEIEVAVKVLPFHVADIDSTAVPRFQKEARATVRIDHPNIVRVFDVKEERGVHYLVMEYVDGESADQRVKREGPLPERDALEIAIGAGEALAAAHAKGILHRDVKPANILIRFEDGRVKLADLGLAKALGGEVGETAGLTATGQMLGTPAYMSPEQAEDASRVDERSDIYSLGATLYSLLTGKAPFEETKLLNLLLKVTREEPEDLSSLRPELTQETAGAVRKLMAKSPLDRLQWMIEAVNLLRGCREASPAEGARGLARPEMAGSRKVKVSVEEATPTPVAPRTLDDVTPSQVRRESEKAEAISPVATPALIAVRMSGGKKLAMVLGIVAALGAGGGAAYLYGSAGASPSQAGASPSGVGTGGRASRRAANGFRGEGEAERAAAVKKMHEEAALTIDLGGGVKLEMVYIKPGRFMMGSNDGAADEEPVHEVLITKGFYLGKFEVTQAQYERVMGTNPSHFKGASNPVETVSWNSAVEFCGKLSQRTGRQVRLPTEAEWEYAARGGSTGKYCFGDDEGRLGDYAWYRSNSGNKTHPVGQNRPNSWGLYDTHGNVWEWCADWYDDAYYGKSPRADPKGPATGTGRVLRGGSWYYFANYCRSASRNWLHPYVSLHVIGFRAAATVAPGP